jgi:hypothetical protein
LGRHFNGRFLFRLVFGRTDRIPSLLDIIGIVFGVIESRFSFYGFFIGFDFFGALAFGL